MHSALIASAFLLPLVSSVALPQSHEGTKTIPITMTITDPQSLATQNHARRGKVIFCELLLIDEADELCMDRSDLASIHFNDVIQAQAEYHDKDSNFGCAHDCNANGLFKLCYPR